MSDTVRRYASEAIEVSYDVRRCIHAAECVRGLPAVFNPKHKPWIAPGEGDTDAIAAVVARCPSGALHFVRHDGGPAEAPPEHNLVRLTPDGPLYVAGAVRVLRGDGSLVVEDTRLALCRCGHSGNKPFCDNSHVKASFADAGEVAATGEAAASGPLTITALPDGPLLLKGPFTLVAASGGEQHGEQAALCRCGVSGNKPFCDGTHKRNGFRDGEADHAA